MTQRSKDDNCEAESHSGDGDNLWPGGQEQVPPGEEQTPPCSHGGSQTTVEKENFNNLLIIIYKSFSKSEWHHLERHQHHQQGIVIFPNGN